MRPVIKKCEVCGKKFKTTRSWQRRCNKEICKEVGFRISQVESYQGKLVEKLKKAKAEGIDVSRLEKKYLCK